jgi:hypothetical protein
VSGGLPNGLYNVASGVSTLAILPWSIHRNSGFLGGARDLLGKAAAIGKSIFHVCIFGVNVVRSLDDEQRPNGK